jgi:hypothetical protein
MNTAPMPARAVTNDHPRPIDTLGNAFVALLSVGAVLIAPQFLWSWVDYGRLAAHLDGALSADEFWGDDSFIWRSETLTSTYLAIPVLMAGTAVLLVWVWRARRNAALLAPAQQFRFSPGFSAGGLLIPVANLWLARPVFEEIWTASRPAGTAPDADRLVRRWWLCLLASSVVSVVGAIAIPTPILTYNSGDTLISGGDDALVAFLGHAVLNTVLLIVAAVYLALFVVMVRQISRWQTDRFAALPVGHVTPPREAVMDHPATPPATRSPFAALVYCTVLALAISTAGVVMLIGGVVESTYVGMFVPVGLVLLTPAVLMWVGIIRLARRPPRGAILLLATVATVGVVVTGLGVFAIRTWAAFGVTGAPPFVMVAVGLAYLGGAALVAGSVFGRSRSAAAQGSTGDHQ